MPKKIIPAKFEINHSILSCAPGHLKLSSFVIFYGKIFILCYKFLFFQPKIIKQYISSRKLYEDLKNVIFYIITLFITQIITVLSKKYAKAYKIRLNGILSFYYLYQTNGSKYNKITYVQNYLKLYLLKKHVLNNLSLIIRNRHVAKYTHLNKYVIKIFV
jgi:hypothetical protein